MLVPKKKDSSYRYIIFLTLFFFYMMQVLVSNLKSSCKHVLHGSEILTHKRNNPQQGDQVLRLYRWTEKRLDTFDEPV